MKKLVILAGGLLVIAGVIWRLSLSNNAKKANSLQEIGQKNLIITALPKKNNAYYDSFATDLVAFNASFKHSLNQRDSLRVMTTQEVNQEKFSFTYDDPWVRDVAPVVTSRLVKFKYSPEYLDKSLSGKLDKRFRKWLDINKFDYHSSPLILDGGNCIWDKKETVIITDRVLTDNHKWTKEDIIEQLKADLKVANVIIIPTEYGDNLSHADGMVKFIGETTLFISDFLGDIEFRHEVESIIRKTLPSIAIVEMASSYVEEGQYDQGIASAKGLYINLLETEKAVYVPQFGLAADDEQLAFVGQYTDKQVIPVAINEIATMGGAINCLTWYCPNHLLPKPL